MNSDPKLSDAKLYGILDTGYVGPERAVAVTRELIDGGIDILQLRAKNATPAEIGVLGQMLHALTAAAGVPLIINDHPEVAAAVGCEGVHLGQDDGSISRAREIVGPDRIIGRSTHSPAQAEAAAAEGADYIGFGPLFTTPTKPGRPAIGTGEIAVVHRRVRLPIFCIGGIKRENLDTILDAGARRVVIVSGFLEAPDIAASVRGVKARLIAAPFPARV